MSGIRTGRVSAIDYESGTYEVTYFDRGESVTRRINAVSNGEYKMPEVGQMVLVNHNDNGAAAAVGIGTLWNKTNKPAEGFKGLFRKEFASVSGRAFIRYDENLGEYTEHIEGSMGRESGKDISDAAEGDITLMAGGSITFRVNGACITVSAGGDVTVESAGAVYIEAPGGDVVIDGISLKEHRHSDYGAGPPVGDNK